MAFCWGVLVKKLGIFFDLFHVELFDTRELVDFLSLSFFMTLFSSHEFADLMNSTTTKKLQAFQFSICERKFIS